MKLSERIRRVARLLARYDQDNPVTEDAYKCADEVAQLETELADFRARRDEKFQDYEDCKEQRDAKQKLLSTWVNKYAELEEERDALVREVTLAIKELVEQDEWETPMKRLCTIAGIKYPAVETESKPISVKQLATRKEGE